jgi:hypothetical protein
MSEVDRTGYIRSLGDTLGITTWTRKKKEREEGRERDTCNYNFV